MNEISLRVNKKNMQKNNKKPLTNEKNCITIGTTFQKEQRRGREE